MHPPVRVLVRLALSTYPVAEPNVLDDIWMLDFPVVNEPAFIRRSALRRYKCPYLSFLLSFTSLIITVFLYCKQAVTNGT